MAITNDFEYTLNANKQNTPTKSNNGCVCGQGRLTGLCVGFTLQVEIYLIFFFFLKVVRLEVTKPTNVLLAKVLNQFY